MALVLIVDDAQFMRMRLNKLLTEAGHQVVEAANGREALEQYARHKPDVVLMDITMPEMDGLTALKELKKLDPGAKVVMCSALGQQSAVLEAIKSGASDFVVKPFEPERVLQAVGKLVK
ncbi:MAG: response regulator [Limnochordales bacterium]|jgi:Response regulator containing CheY-like receiver, AAA-type ATPase, and DNA-binding domains|nr:two-component system response regulator [Bacillota bacterium]